MANIKKDKFTRFKTRVTKGEIKEGKFARYWKRPFIIRAYQTDEEVEIETLEGKMKADKGDWIIKGVQGELYPCKPDIFDATYKKIEPYNNKKRFRKEWNGIFDVLRWDDVYDIAGTMNRLHEENLHLAEDNNRMVQFIKSKGYTLKDYLAFIKEE